MHDARLRQRENPARHTGGGDYNLQYSGIVFAAIYSVVLFGDQIPAIGWIGMVLIVASGIASTVLLRSRLRPARPRKH